MSQTINPEDRVRVKNIVDPENHVETFYLNRKKKIQRPEATVGQNGVFYGVGVATVEETEEIEWNFAKGFFFLYGGRAYVLKPGEERVFPRFLADHCTKHMVNHIKNRMYAKSEKRFEDGHVGKDSGILKDTILTKKLTKQIVLAVEEYYEQDDSSFDDILNQKYGGDVESYLNDDAEETYDKRDTVLDEVDMTDSPLEELITKKVKPSKDAKVNELRVECDQYLIDWTEADDAESLKAKLIKAMA